jgi:hypothetical protein
MGINKIFDDGKVNYMKKTIVQASHAKGTLEKLSINKSSHTVFSLDIESFYPSVPYSLVEIAINYFAEKLPMKEKLTIQECLKCVHFGMVNTLITFEDKYFEYDGDRDVNDKGLTIGRYESAWLADLVAAFVLKNTAQFFNEAVYTMESTETIVLWSLKATGPNKKSPSGSTASKQKLTRLPSTMDYSLQLVFGERRKKTVRPTKK